MNWPYIHNILNCVVYVGNVSVAERLLLLYAAGYFNYQWMTSVTIDNLTKLRFILTIICKFTESISFEYVVLYGDEMSYLDVCFTQAYPKLPEKNVQNYQLNDEYI